MGILSKVGRIFYGIVIAEMGLQAIYFRKLPYMMIPPTHFSPPVLALLAYIFGVLFVLAGVSIIFELKIRPVSLLLGTVLLLIFCFYFIPYQFMTGTFKDFEEWENAEK